MGRRQGKTVEFLITMRLSQSFQVQKPAVAKQTEWDLGAYRIVMWLYEKSFDLPAYFVVGELFL